MGVKKLQRRIVRRGPAFRRYLRSVNDVRQGRIDKQTGVRWPVAAPLGPLQKR